MYYIYKILVVVFNISFLMVILKDVLIGILFFCIFVFIIIKLMKQDIVSWWRKKEIN